MSGPPGPAYIAEGLRPLAVPRSRLRQMPKNPRRGVPDAIAASLSTFGQRKPVVARADGTIIAGNHTDAAAELLGWDQLAVVWVDDDDTTAHAYALADNRTAELGGYDEAALAALIAEVQDADAELLAATAWTDEDLRQLLIKLNDAAYTPTNPALAARFGVPPLSLLDSRAGYWRERKAQWLALGLDSKRGRPEKAGAYYAGYGTAPVPAKLRAVSDGISVFDPVLAELAYRWFSPPGGAVLDPFAGGSVRGIVASACGRAYTGIDLSAVQLEANAEQWAHVGPLLAGAGPAPMWRRGDSAEVVPGLPGRYELVFSCPPFADLERYSDDPADISNMPYDQCLAAYRAIIAAAVERLAPERFAVFVVGDVRGPGGFYRPFVTDTITAFEDAGARLYNDAVFVTSYATAGLRAGGFFEQSRKITRVHQRVLVFYRGDDPRLAVADFGPCAFGELPTEAEA